MKKKFNQKQIDKENPPVLSDEDMNPRNFKARINTFIDLDVLDEIRKQAAEKGLKYQTLLNLTLREVFVTKKRSLNALTEEDPSTRKILIEILKGVNSLKHPKQQHRTGPAYAHAKAQARKK
ncbi:MAG: hypothetical protein HQK52_19495 [Oligoflexia bacterium]|nr:hypothetical protein [Oligoflexia bacterium]